MRARALYGEWKPDTLPFLSNDLQLARNVYASSNGYRPVPGLSEFADALDGPFRGGASYVASDDTPRLIAGDDTDLYHLVAGEWESVLGSMAVGTFWQFAQFGDDAICVNGDDPVAFDLLAGTAAALGGSPPTADLVAVVRDFVVLGRVDDDVNAVAWCDIGDATDWSGGQAGTQPLYQGGKVMGIVGGEYGLILQRFGITRMTYTGDAADPWQFDQISTNYGCVAERSIVHAGDIVFCLSDRGFVRIQGGGITPIGAEKIDRTFRETYSPDDFRKMTASVDPERTLAFWAMPYKIFCYNWTLERWTDWVLPVMAVFPSFSESVSLEQLDALYPGGLESIPYSLDSFRFSGGVPRLTLVGINGTFNALGGPNLEAKFVTANIEMANGRKSRVRTYRPLGDAVDGISVKIEYGDRLGDTFGSETYTDLRSNGDMPVRVASRYMKTTQTIAAGSVWHYAQGAEYEFEAGGRQ